MKKNITKFCYKHPNFGISDLMKYITIANVVFWLIIMVKPEFESYMAFNPMLILQGQIWRIISFAMIPPSTGIIALIAFYFYYWIGSTLEKSWGTTMFNLYYFSGIVLSIIYGFVIYFIFNVNVWLESTYIYLSMFLSFAALFPDMKVLFMFIIPIKMKYLAFVDIALLAASVFFSNYGFPLNLLPLVAILNFVIFCGGEIFQSYFRKNITKPINFRKASKEINKDSSKNLYKHKCAVCGKTDMEYPNMEFRFCSKCNGYHCFCEEHINSHIHFTE